MARTHASDVRSLSGVEVPELTPGEAVFQYSRIASAAGLVIISVLVVAGAVGGSLGGWQSRTVHLPPIVCYSVSGALFLFALVSFPQALKSFCPENWLVRLSSGRLLIKFRTHLNRHFDSHDVQIWEIPTNLVESAQELRVTEMWEEASRLKCVKRHFLMLRLRGVNTEEMGRQIEEERKRVAPAGGVVRSKAEHYPVTIAGPGVVKIEWNGVSPGIRASLGIFRNVTSVLPPVTAVRDFRKLRQLPRAEQDLALREIARTGDLLEAVSLAQGVLGLSTGEAMTMLSEGGSQVVDRSGSYRHTPEESR